MVIVMTATPEGIHYRSDTRRSESDQGVSCEYTADYDGRPAVVRGSAGLMAPVALKQVNATTVEATYMRDLQVTASSRRVLSENAQVMTISTMWRGVDGQSHTNVAVFERATSRSTVSISATRGCTGGTRSSPMWAYRLVLQLAGRRE
jgi:hypothetical protein